MSGLRRVGETAPIAASPTPQTPKLQQPTQCGPRLHGTRATRGTTRLDALQRAAIHGTALVPGSPGGPPRTRPQKSPRPTGTRVTRGTTLVDAASRRIHSWRSIARHSVVSYLALDARVSRRARRFASAAQGRVQAACCTGLTPTPGSLSNTATVLVPVIAFRYAVVVLAECTGHPGPLSTRGQNAQNGQSTRDTRVQTKPRLVCHAEHPGCHPEQREGCHPRRRESL